MKIENYTFDNITGEIIYYIGRNAKDNFVVIDNSNANDIWFHAADYSSCHVVAKIPENMNKKQLKTIIKKGVLLCKQNTLKLRDMNNIKFIYTRIGNITKCTDDGSVISNNTKTEFC